ncbi:MAG: radical SAM family heme chaperone HemW [Pseudotabrizicola sp.]|uniref:radical SAM family heme chaperone HemW n=1 Tax=Pseudotabrizicola sp. TaxID=2939647 RepID=UPI00272FFB15|nr:radical SAM family heme chaperone HemW [Pseudotabrizicola sp.]MDP2083399.1 radical SAM family heme chaperone HemW [Pseudotabrizicola sp.]MDZ7574937.1 radical SAM family heme chaperone HemW [Pseudotabrizicola sp.]
MHRWQTAGFGLYVHWPFCQSKCPYCDFNSHVSSQIDHDEWRVAYLAQLRRFAEETPGRVLQSIFFGGGTPSLMRARTVAAIIDEATQLWTPANDIEITLEANPTSVEIGGFKDFRAAGVNRVSVGVQALNNADLRRLGRMHDAQEARAAIDISQKVFDRTSFDLIYARQDQSLVAWEAELSEALKLAGDHLSLYQLTIEPGTVFGARHALGLLRGLPEEDAAADMYELTQDVCIAHGRPQYEISNHAPLGGESRHNMIYWRCGDYIGIGPGAHGRLTDAEGRRVSTVQPSAPNLWLAASHPTSDGKHDREDLSRDAQATEFVLMGLRLVSGVCLKEYQSIAGAPLPLERIERLRTQGVVDISDGRLRTTLKGRLVLNWVLNRLLQE